jgi:hypothetical protein
LLKPPLSIRTNRSRELSITPARPGSAELKLQARPRQSQQPQPEPSHLAGQLRFVGKEGMVSELLEHQLHLCSGIQAMVGISLLVLDPGLIKGLGKAVGVIEHPVGLF